MATTYGTLRSSPCGHNVGIVHQDVYLFSASIRDNISYGVVGATQEDVERAAKVAQLHDQIMSLPGGYDTWVGERGTTLSGGQRQRLSIARTILIDPPVLILDDSTSSVDVETERQIHRAMTEVMKGRTTFVIAHRLSTVREADQILVLDKGVIAERGSHAELLRKNGIYQSIYELQLRPQEEVLLEAAVPALREGCPMMRGGGMGGGMMGGMRGTSADSMFAPTNDNLTDEEVVGRVYDNRVVKRFATYIQPYRKYALIALASLLVYAAVNAAIPLLIKYGIDWAVANGDGNRVHIIGAAFMVVTVIHFLSNRLQFIFISLTGQHILYDLRSGMFSHLQNQSNSFYHRTPIGRIMSRMQSDILQLQETFELMALALAELVTVGAIIILMLIIDWQLALVCMLVVPILTLILMYWQRFARHSFMRIRRAIAMVNGEYNQNITRGQGGAEPQPAGREPRPLPHPQHRVSRRQPGSSTLLGNAATVGRVADRAGHRYRRGAVWRFSCCSGTPWKLEPSRRSPCGYRGFSSPSGS